MTEQAEIPVAIKPLIERLVSSEGVYWNEGKTGDGRHFICLKSVEENTITIYEVAVQRTMTVKFRQSPIVIPAKRLRLTEGNGMTQKGDPS